MNYIPTEAWARFETIINDFRESIGKQPIVWRRTNAHLDRYQEGEEKLYDEILLEGLIEYPFQRKWVIDRVSIEGQTDKMYSGIYLNIQYLKDSGYLNSENTLDFDTGRDSFYFNGFWHKAAGLMQAAQTDTKPLYLILLVERDEKITGGPDIPI
jgi:hypothetical protein